MVERDERWKVVCQAQSEGEMSGWERTAGVGDLDDYVRTVVTWRQQTGERTNTKKGK